VARWLAGLSAVLLLGAAPAAGAEERYYTSLPPEVNGYDAGVHIHIHSPAEAQAIRKKVVDYFWPAGKLPETLPEASPAYEGQGGLPADLAGLDAQAAARAERLVVTMDFGFQSIAYLVRPARAIRADRLVILHQGHQGGLSDGIGVLANRLLREGFSVLIMQMPLIGWNKCKTFQLPDRKVEVTSHDQLVSAVEGRGGSALRFFIEPVVVGINYFLARRPDHSDITMIGLSGGGWTTHIAPAVDPRIRLSIPVAGAYPLYLRSCYPGSVGDAEQMLAALYHDRASWLDLFILGGYGAGRRQIQLLNQYDPCCFYGLGYTTYEDKVSAAVRQLGQGEFSCVLDSSHREHKISDWAIENVILPALSVAPQPATAPTSSRKSP